MQVVRENPAFCVTLATIPKQSMTYNYQSVWIGAPAPLSPPQWDLNITVFCNTEGQAELSKNNTTWLIDLRQAIPEAIWDKPPQSPPTYTLRTKLPRVFKKELEEDENIKPLVPPEIGPGPCYEPRRNVPLQPKVSDWRTLACTDGSCLNSF